MEAKIEQPQMHADLGGWGSVERCLASSVAKAMEDKCEAEGGATTPPIRIAIHQPISTGPNQIHPRQTRPDR
jgi:hypothetical protein